MGITVTELASSWTRQAKSCQNVAVYHVALNPRLGQRTKKDAKRPLYCLQMLLLDDQSCEAQAKDRENNRCAPSFAGTNPLEKRRLMTCFSEKLE